MFSHLLHVYAKLWFIWVVQHLRQEERCTTLHWFSEATEYIQNTKQTSRCFRLSRPSLIGYLDYRCFITIRFSTHHLYLIQKYVKYNFSQRQTLATTFIGSMKAFFTWICFLNLVREINAGFFKKDPLINSKDNPRALWKVYLSKQRCHSLEPGRQQWWSSVVRTNRGHQHDTNSISVQEWWKKKF